MRIRQITARQTRILSDRAFGNYQAEVGLTADLDGDEQTLGTATLAFRRVSDLLRQRVLDDVQGMRSLQDTSRLEE